MKKNLLIIVLLVITASALAFGLIQKQKVEKLEQQVQETGRIVEQLNVEIANQKKLVQQQLQIALAEKQRAEELKLLVEKVKRK